MDLQNIKPLIEEKADVNAIFEDGEFSGMSLLTIACYTNSNDTIKYLLSLPEVDVNIENDDLFEEADTPLTTCVESDNLEGVKLLLNDPNIDPNKLGSYYQTPLVKAISNSNIKIVEALLNHPDIDINSNDDYDTPLEVAINLKENDIVKLLLKRQDLDTVNESLFSWACEEDDLDTIKLIVEKFSVEFKYPRKTFMMMAILKRNVSVVKFLLKYPHIDVNTSYLGKTPLMMACKNDDVDIIKLLLDNKRVDRFKRDENGKMYQDFMRKNTLKYFFERNILRELL